MSNHGSNTRVLPVIVPDIYGITSIYKHISSKMWGYSSFFFKKIAKNGEAAWVCKKIKLRVESVNLDSSSAVNLWYLCASYLQDSGKYYIEQIEICMDKTFTPINCESGRYVSSHKTNTLFFIPSQRLSSDPDIQDCGSGDVYYKPFQTMK